MDLKDKVVIVTGGKRIGRIVAQQVAAHGADLVLSYRGSRQEAEDTVRDVEARGRRAIAVAADVSKAADELGFQAETDLADGLAHTIEAVAMASAA